MSSKRRLRRISCSKKKRYSQNEAESKSAHLRQNNIEVYAYECSVGCSYWHIGHRPNKLQRLRDTDNYIYRKNEFYR